MVAKIVSGKSIRGVLHYNENKVAKGEASLILASGFATDIDRLSFHQKLQRFNNLNELNGRVKTNAIHISLNFDASDDLDLAKLQQIAQTYMEQIGFGEQPYIAYQHFDAAHPHIHIATTLIQKNGQRKHTHNIGRLVSEPARKTIEKQFGLTKAEGRNQSRTLTITPAVYGEKPSKQIISSILHAVIDNYSFTSLAEFNALLGQFNIKADRGNEGTMMFQRRGLLYSILDENRNPVGVPIKASSLYSRPTLANLEQKFLESIQDRKPLKENLKKRIDQLLAKYTSMTKETLQRELAKEQIAIVYRQNENGWIYGVTYIDHKQKTVFNGSNLGKQYSAKGLTELLAHSDQVKTYLKQQAITNQINKQQNL